MSVHWSSEIMKWEYRDLQATAMSVDYSGVNVLLAGRRWLAIKQIGVEEEADVIKKYPRQSKYDAAGAEWCQTHSGQRLCAISSNQRVDVFHWRNGELTCTNSLRGHTRVVSDTHFHRQDHNLIATCSVDTFTHIWDLRDARKPVLSFCAVAGASQVQWNKVASHVLATAHDGDIKIWDKRKGSSPLHYISAHLCKIHGVDWSPHHEYQLVTSSHDGSIKYFDINNARRPENTITTNFPVWRAIYTPFGSGLLTIGVGWGGLRRGEQAGVVGIWVGGTLTHRLVGHTDTVTSMVWRPNSSPSNYQLVTWARDHTLRVWTMHPSLLSQCQHYLPFDPDSGDDTTDSLSFTSATSSLNDLTLSDTAPQDIQMVKLSPHKPSASLNEEFESVRNTSDMVVKDMSMDARTCTVRIERNGLVACLQVTFPKNSAESIPKFSWLSGTTIDSANTIKMLQSINRVAYSKKKEGTRCLLHCLKNLANAMDEMEVKRAGGSEDAADAGAGCAEAGGGDARVPYPRSCGARFGGTHLLLVYTRPPPARAPAALKHDATATTTPRCLSSVPGGAGAAGAGAGGSSPLPSPSLSPQLSSFATPRNSITTFYFHERWKGGRRSVGEGRARGPPGSASAPPGSRLLLYNCATLFHVSRALADKYVITPENPVEMCERNANVCLWEGGGGGGVARAWRLAAQAARALSPPDPALAQLEPASRKLASRDPALAQLEPAPAPHPLRQLSCEEATPWALHPLGAPLVHALISHYAREADIQTAATMACAFSLVHQHQPAVSTADKSRCSGSGAGVVDAQAAHLYAGLKRAYADMLLRWQLLHTRAQVMKRVVMVEEACAGPELAAACPRCGQLVTQPACPRCRVPVLRCAVCGLVVRGVAVSCSECGHAGHVAHMASWFETHDRCPRPCPCKCVVLAPIAAHHYWPPPKLL